MTYLIYRATSRTSGGSYIGLTSRLLIFRQREHWAAVKTGRNACPAFTAAMRKHGVEDFEWEILIDGLEGDEASHLEAFLISAYRPRYNAAPGGSTGDRLGPSAVARAVICINTGIAYESGTAAAKAHSVSQMTVSIICNRGGQTKKGWRFRFADSEEVVRVPRTQEQIEAGRKSRVEKLKARRHSPETIERMKVAAKKRGVSRRTREIGDAKKRKPIVCVETGTVFRDANEAAMAHGVKRSHIYDRIFKERPSGIAMVSFRHALPHEVGMMNVRER